MGMLSEFGRGLSSAAMRQEDSERKKTNYVRLGLTLEKRRKTKDEFFFFFFFSADVLLVLGFKSKY